MKVSFDFDDTLSLERVQFIAEALKHTGDDIWIVTSRYEDLENYTRSQLGEYNNYTHDDLFKTADALRIPRNHIIFTNFEDKALVLLHNGFDMHFDDNPAEIAAINKLTDKITTFLVNPTNRDLNY